MATEFRLPPERVLSCSEVRTIVEHYDRCWRLAATKRYAVHRRTNYTVFRLACLGLRVGEISGLNLGDVVTFGDRPCIRVRKETSKGVAQFIKGQRITVRFGRSVPLWWDPRTLEDIKWYVQFRREQIAAQVANGVSPTVGIP